MTIAIKIPSASFSKIAQKARVPDRSGLLGEYYFGGNANDSRINYANRDAPLSLSGAPTYSAGYATVTKGNGFDTAMLETQDYTYVAIAEVLGSVPYVTNLGNSSPQNSLAYNLLGSFSGSSSINCESSVSTASTKPRSTYSISGISGSWGMIAGRAANAASPHCRTSIYTGGGARVDAGLSTGTNRDVDDNGTTLLIGASRLAAHGTYTAKLGAILIFNRELSNAELDELYVRQRAFHAGRGLTI